MGVRQPCSDRYGCSTLVASLVAVAAVDFALMRIPSRILYGGAAVGVPLLVVASAGTGNWTALARAALVGVAALLVFLLLFVGVPRGIGFGDVRLAAFCGLFLGWLGYRQAVEALVLAFVAGGLVAVGLVTARRAGRKSKLPFGPYLALGTMIAALWGTEIARVWWR